MKKTAIVLNLLVAGFALYLFVEEGLPRRTSDVVMLFTIAITPIVSIAALLLQTPSGDILSLYLQRKAMEENKRIREISKET